MRVLLITLALAFGWIALASTEREAWEACRKLHSKGTCEAQLKQTGE